jgi:hypothetical protein
MILNSKKEWIRKRIENGICVQCGKERDGKSKRYCLACSSIFLSNSKVRQEILLKSSLCISCGKNPLHSSKHCKDCLDRFTANRKVKKETFLAKNLCSRCGKQEIVKGNTRCTVCILKHMAWNHMKDGSKWIDLKNIFEKQNGMCPYTGRQIQIGVDAELDHIVPVAKGGTSEFENYQWVYNKINMMKLDQMHKDFLCLIKEVCDYLKL